MASTPLVHGFGATGAGTPVNAYIVEGASGVAVVDATLTVSDGRALRERVDALGKPLLGVVVTHAHPDHYGGLAELVGGPDAPATVFSADVAYDRRHCYLADGFHEQWLANIARLRAELPAGATLHPGH